MAFTVKGNMLLIVTMVVMVAHLTQCARILMAVPIGTRSHNNFYVPIAEFLALRNHSVTFVSHYKPSTKVPNIEAVVVENMTIYDTLPNMFTSDIQMVIASAIEGMKTECIHVLGSEEMRSLRNKQFDLVMIHPFCGECLMSLGYIFKAPVVFVNPNKIVSQLASLAGTPLFPAVDPSYFLDLPLPLTFMSRMVSTLYDIVWITFQQWIMIPSHDAACRALELCPQDMPNLADLVMNGSLFITNSVKTMENPTLPNTPTVVYAGGIHCRPAQPLPQDLEQWMAASGKSGVIYFSLGTLVKSSTMPEKYLKVLLEVFGSLPQRVLWKWDQDTIEGLPHNVKLSRWLPQQDLLGHPQLRLFITHGGLFSTQEATYHGVPVLGLPVSIDQKHNMHMIEREGWGRCLEWENLTYDTLRGYILNMTFNTRMQEEVERRSRVMRDQPVHPGDWVTYWVEYVLRHRGAPHLRSPVTTLPWYQLYNVDVWAVVVVVVLVAVILTTWITYRILRAVVGCCCRSKKTKKD